MGHFQRSLSSAKIQVKVKYKRLLSNTAWLLKYVLGLESILIETLCHSEIQCLSSNTAQLLIHVLGLESITIETL